MPINPNFLERLLIHRLNRGPAPILDLFGAGSFEAVTLALDVGVFETLADGALPLGDLAARLDADEEGLRALLDFLAAQGYVAADGDRYRNTEMTETWLLEASETNMAPWLTFWNDLVFPFWEAHLETAIREGAPPQTIYEWFDEEPSRWETAQRGFRAAATLILDEVTDAVAVPDGATRLLDVGGGHGLYAIDLCRRHPALAATVFDTEAALAAVADEVAETAVGERLTLVGGDYWTDDLGHDHDVALVFNVIHAHDGAKNRELFERVAASLAPGGRIAVLDQLEGSARMPVGKSGLGFVGLTYLTTLGAETHPYDEVEAWLRAAGFEDVTRTAIRSGGPGNTLVQATKPEAGR
ncbi:methyltransferase [Haloglomus litoreum]|uniref:methyltransferase n=1 Tax=Haloglomus litoreum TaxID=3034026 RepID=UPI0023E8E133|nr:methyltransferase [Haloglomus sp. DT116]